MSLACSTSSIFGTTLHAKVTAKSTRGSKQVTSARFFDRPEGDKKEAKRFQNSETKKKKGLYVPLDKKLRDAIPGKARKMAGARNRGPEGDGRKVKTSSAVPGSTSLPDDAAPLVAGGLAALFIVVALLATGNIGAGSIQLPSAADLPSPPVGSIHL